MFRLEKVDNICLQTFFVFEINGAFWVSEKEKFFNKKNFYIIAVFNEYQEFIKTMPKNNYVNEMLIIIKDNIKLFYKINDDIGLEIEEENKFKETKYVSYLITNNNDHYAVIVKIEKTIERLFKDKATDYSYEQEISITAIRKRWAKGKDLYINTEEDHKVPITVSKGDIVTTIANMENRYRLTFNYHSEYNLNFFDDCSLVNYYVVPDIPIKKSPSIFFVKESGKYQNDRVIKKEPLFDYNKINRFNKKQTKFITKMENLELENAFIINENTNINQMVIKTNFGVIHGITPIQEIVAFTIRNVVRTKGSEFYYQPGLLIYVENMNDDYDKHVEYIRCNAYGNVTIENKWSKHEREVFIKNSSTTGFQKHKATLIVVPLSTFNTWKKEIAELLKEVGFENEIKVQYGGEIFANSFKISGEPNIILTTNNIYNKYVTNPNSEMIMFNRVIFEDHVVNKYSLGNESIQGRFKWLIMNTTAKSITEVDESKEYSSIGDIEMSGLSFKNVNTLHKIMKCIQIAPIF